MSARRGIGLKVFLVIFGLVLLGVFVMVLGGQPTGYRPPYKLSMALEPDPVRGFQTPYRTILCFRAKGKRDDVFQQVLKDLQSQNIQWNVKKPGGADVSYHIDNPSQPDRSRAEGLNVYADPTDPRMTVVSIVSPWMSPSKIQVWMYGAKKWIRRED